MIANTPAHPTLQSSAYEGRNGKQFAIESYGVRTGLWIDDRCDFDATMVALPPRWSPIAWDGLDRVFRFIVVPADDLAGGDERYRLEHDGEDAPVRRTVGAFETAIEQLESELHHYIAEFSTELLFVHAGVIAIDGCGVVVPGRSFTGKSTLITALVNAGATYYSDEYALLDRDGLVHPFTRRAKLREGPFGSAGRRDLASRTVEELPPLPVSLVALLRFDANSGWDIEPLTGAGAIMAVCDHTVAIRRRPADSFAMIGAMVDATTVIQGTRGDIDDTVSRIQELVRGAGSPSV